MGQPTHGLGARPQLGHPFPISLCAIMPFHNNHFPNLGALYIPIMCNDTAMCVTQSMTLSSVTYSQIASDSLSAWPLVLSGSHPHIGSLSLPCRWAFATASTAPCESCFPIPSLSPLLPFEKKAQRTDPAAHMLCIAQWLKELVAQSACKLVALGVLFAQIPIVSIPVSVPLCHSCMYLRIEGWSYPCSGTLLKKYVCHPLRTCDSTDIC